jgi:hypothetical protein
MLEARVHPALEGDVALRDVLIGLSNAESLRPGELLAPFGIRWIVFNEPSPLEEAFASKLDVKPLPLTDFEAVYENIVPSPVAAEIDGDPWVRTGNGYAGPPSESRVRIASNADAGWQPDPAASDWAVTVSASEGSAAFSQDTEKALYAWVAAGLLILLSALALIGRKIGR